MFRAGLDLTKAAGRTSQKMSGCRADHLLHRDQDPVDDADGGARNETRYGHDAGGPGSLLTQHYDFVVILVGRHLVLPDLFLSK